MIITNQGLFRFINISFTHRLIEDEKKLLENELRDYEFKAGGILALDMIFIANVSSESLASLRKLPVQAMVATTWRSGSTFLGIFHINTS